MVLEIRPHAGFGPINFGMTRAQVVESMRMTPRKLEKGKVADLFEDFFLFVFYDQEGACEAVEAGAPSPVQLMGQPVFERPFFAVRDWLKELDPAIRLDRSGLTSIGLGICLYLPGALECPEEPIEGIMAFRPGYYV